MISFKLTQLRFLLIALLFALPQLVLAGKPASNALPTVTLTSPANGSTYNAPASITLTASATDSDGTIAKVEFFRGSTLIASVTSAPYTFAWSGVAAGTYSLTAKATDNSGGAKTSTAVSITVNATTPSGIAITSPTANALTYNLSTVTGTFVGPSNSTVLVDNGEFTRVATLSGNAFTVNTMYVGYGPQTLTATVSRPDKTFSTTSVNITNSSDPQLVITSPSQNEVAVGTSLTLRADAQSPAGSISRVEFYKGQTFLGSVTAPPYAVTFTNPAAGSFALTATVYDSQGYTGGDSRLLNVLGPNQLPSITLTSPLNGASFFQPATINLAANASDPDGSIVSVDFYQNGVFLGSTNVAPYTYTWANVQGGSYSLTAKATDNRGGATTSTPISVLVGVPPTVSVTAPVSGSKVPGPVNIVISATANADVGRTVANVQFFAGSTLIGNAATTPYTYTWPSVAPGTYSLTAKAYDNLGLSATSSPVTVTVTPPPAVSITAPVGGSNILAPADITINVSATDSFGTISSVEIYQGATLLTTLVSPPYTYVLKNVPIGSYTFTAKATNDQAISGISTPISVNVTAPSITITSPLDGASLNTSSTQVKGKVVAPRYSGVVVNGVIATVDENGNFFANDVSLQQGSNTLTVTVTTVDEITATKSITVAGTAPRPIQITASPSAGVGQLVSSFSVSQTQLQKIEVDFNGDGSTDLLIENGQVFASPGTVTASNVIYDSTSNTFRFNANSSTPGIYQVRVTTTDTLGASYSKNYVLEVLDPVKLDQQLMATWNRMLDKLRGSDISGALTAISGGVREKYQVVFTALQPDLLSVANQLGTLSTGAMSTEMAEYTLTRDVGGSVQGFLVYFLLGEDGVWRVDGM